jgi:hypothetical protein
MCAEITSTGIASLVPSSSARLGDDVAPLVGTAFGGLQSVLGMFPMWLVLVPLPGTRPMYALLLALYFDALCSPGDSVAGPRRSFVTRRVVLELLRFARTRPSRTAQRGRGAAPAPAASAGSDPHWLQWFNGPH